MRSTPLPPALDLTFAHASSSVPSADTLSIRLNHRFPFTPLSRAVSMRSDHTPGSAPATGRTASPPCLSLTGTDGGFVSLDVLIARSPSWVPSLHRRYPASTLLWTL